MNKKKKTIDSEKSQFEIHPSLQNFLDDTNWYKTLVDTMAQGIIASDLNQRIVYVNPKICDMLDYSKEELLGKDAVDIVIENDRERVIRQTESRYQTKNSSQYEVTLKSRLGSRIPVVMSATPIIGENNQTIGTYAILTDIRDRKIVEQELRKKNDELQSLYNNLLELYEQVGAIIAETTKFHQEIYLFTSKNCVYCAPAEEVLQEVLASYGGKITYRKVDIDKEPELAGNYDIMSLPTIVIGEEQLTAVPDVYRLHSALFSALVPEEKFRRTRQELDNIIENSPIAIFTINTKGIITSGNSLLELMFGSTKKSLIGKNVFEDKFGKEQKAISEGILNLFKKAFIGDKVSVNRLYFRELDLKQPEPFSIISFKAVPLTNKEGEVMEILILSEDVTLLAIQEEELALSYKRLEELNEQLVQMNKKQTNFMEMTTTNLLEPLRNSAKLINQILSGKIGEINEEIYGTLEYLRTNLDTVSKSILDILDFASIETQGLTLEFAPYDVNTLVSEAMESLGSIIIDKGFVLMKEIPEKLTVYCDRAQIVRVLKNIIVNALKFTEKECNITVGAKKTGDNMIKLWVEDNGIGIKKADLDRIFDQYYKVDPKSQGSGLGLSVAKSIVEAHYGTIKAESEGKNKGSTFILVLPKDKKTYEQLASQQAAEKIEIDA